MDTTKEKLKMAPRLSWYYDGCLVRWNKKRKIDWTVSPTSNRNLCLKKLKDRLMKLELLRI
jgi:hypothetical protein